MNGLRLAWGDDLELLNQARHELAQELAAGSEPPARLRIDLGRRAAKREMIEIESRLRSGTLLGGGLLVELLADDGDPDATTLRAVERLLRSIAPGNGIIIRDQRERRPNRKGVSSPKLSALIETHGGSIIRCVSPVHGELGPWLRSYAAQHELTMDEGVAELIAARVGAEARELDLDRSTMRASAVRELEKLASAAGDAPISLTNASDLVLDRALGSIFAFLDAVVMRDGLAIARHLERANEEPGWRIVSSLHRRLRDLMIIRSLLRSGMSVGAASERSGINEWSAKTLATAADRWKTREIGAALEGILAIDRAAAAGEGPRRLALAIWSSEIVR